MILALIIATAATAAEMTQPGSSDWISGSTLVAILTLMCGGGGVMLGRQAGIRRGREEEAERRRIEGKVEVPVPQPMTTEQSAYQAQCKDNAADHTNLFSRVSKLEQTVAALDAKMDATFNSIQRQLDSMNTMLSQLFERICKKR